MPLKKLSIALLSTVCVLSCSKKPETTDDKKPDPAFEMTIAKVEDMKGMVMKGSSVSGIVSKGCVANHDPMMVTREGTVLVESTAKIINIRGNGSMGANAGQTQQGDEPYFYLPDIYSDTVKVGDVVTATTSTCNPRYMRQNKP